MRADTLKVGDWVQVRSRDEILATLDDNGRVDGLPFMPEMLAFAGRRFPVDAVAHRTCDTVKSSGTSGTTRRMDGAVHLDGLRCDGSAHGGCQAQCLLFWKEDWLEAAPPGESQDSANSQTHAVVDVPAELAAATRREDRTTASEVYSCQATELLDATEFVSARDPRMWVRDLRSGNASVRRAIAGLAVLVFNKWQAASRRLPWWLRIDGGQSWPRFTPTGEHRTYPALDLQPGELVDVKSQREIEATLNDDGAVRSLRFSAEMLPYCGQQLRVHSRVERIIDEKTGRMLKLRDCIILEDAWCLGTFRALCSRKIYTFWREAWLRRVDEHETATNAGSRG